MFIKTWPDKPCVVRQYVDFWLLTVVIGRASPSGRSRSMSFASVIWRKLWKIVDIGDNYMTLCPLPVSRKTKASERLVTESVQETFEAKDKHRRITLLERLRWKKNSWMTIHSYPPDCIGYKIILDICHFFTRAKFLENKIYTEKCQFFALNL